MAAAFVCNILGLPTDYANHAAYVATWLKKLKTDKYEIFRCAADAQRIADWTLGYHPEYAARVSHSDRNPKLNRNYRRASRWSSRPPLGGNIADAPRKGLGDAASRVRSPRFLRITSTTST